MLFALIVFVSYGVDMCSEMQHGNKHVALANGAVTDMAAGAETVPKVISL